MTDSCNPINVVGGPLEPLPQNAGYTPLTAPGQFSANGINAPANQSTDVQALALTTMNAYTVVKVGAGGVQPVDPTVPGDQSKIFGITLSGVTAGQPVQVRLAGVVQNNLPGMQSWNWTVGQPIYVGPLGVLQSVPNTTGWNMVVGQAVAAISLDFFVQPSAVFQRVPTVVQYASASQSLALDASTTDSADIALNASGAVLTINNGSDGQTIKLAVTQGSAGGNTLTITGLIGAYTATATANKIDLLTLRYVAARSAWVLVASTLDI